VPIIYVRKLLKFYFQSFLLGVPVSDSLMIISKDHSDENIQEILVGFRTPAGQLVNVQSFKTIEIPRLVRGKPGAWDPSICLAWGDRFLVFLRGVVDKPNSDAVWRVRFEPQKGVTVVRLTTEDVLEVVGGDDRVGFLPRDYYEAELSSADAHNEPGSGWQI
jgi:RAT1-interacting protein